TGPAAPIRPRYPGRPCRRPGTPPTPRAAGRGGGCSDTSRSCPRGWAGTGRAGRRRGCAWGSSNRDGGRLQLRGGRRVHELALPGFEDHQRQQQVSVVCTAVQVVGDDRPQGVRVEDAAAETLVA